MSHRPRPSIAVPSTARGSIATRLAWRGVAVAVLLCALPGVAAVAADLAAGEKLAKERCAACHGQDFKTSIDPSYPKLAGQHEDYLYQALAEYTRSAGSLFRKHAVMGPQALTLSDADRRNLAAYLSSLSGDLYVRK